MKEGTDKRRELEKERRRKKKEGRQEERDGRDGEREGGRESVCVSVCVCTIKMCGTA
jgi:hypothetical protein